MTFYILYLQCLIIVYTRRIYNMSDTLGIIKKARSRGKQTEDIRNQVSVEADFVYVIKTALYDNLSHDKFETFSNLNEREKENLIDALIANKRQDIFEALKPRMEKLVKLILDENFQQKLSVTDLPDEAKNILQNHYEHGSNSIKNKINAKKFREQIYNSFITEYINFIKIDADMMFKEHMEHLQNP